MRNEDADIPGVWSAVANPPMQHLAVIMDGNRRWAAKNNLPVTEGYRQGGAAVATFLSWCDMRHIPQVTLWPLSLENLKRDAQEIDALLGIIVDVIDGLAAIRRWRLNFFGELCKLPGEVVQSIERAQAFTRGESGMWVNIAIAYSGRDEIVSAFRKILIEREATGELSNLAETLSLEDVNAHLYSAGNPDPDLIIRTSGEQRLSGFMPWQSAFSEYYFSSVCWPEFSKNDFDAAINSYLQRQRRFGA
ncbi:polyprenyl diphosphate synthase [Pseudomonas yamanorum]